MKKTLIVLTLLIMLPFWAGCQKSPSDVVIAAYMAANKGKYSETEKYLPSSSAIMNSVKEGLVSRAVFNAIWDEATRNGTIEKIEILKEEIRGEGAKVSFRIYYKDGKTIDNDEPLIKEKRRWKIVMP